MVFGKCQDKFGQFSRFKNDSNYLEVNLKAFKEDDKKKFYNERGSFQPVFEIEESARQSSRKLC